MLTKLLIASDHAGYKLKEQLVEKLMGIGIEVIDLGCDEAGAISHSDDYPDFAVAMAQRITDGEAALGVLVCGTGIGMSIAANKFPGIRAALCHDTYSARSAREHNDSNVLCLGARVVGSGLAGDIVLTWLQASFSGGRHQQRVEKIAAIEARR